MLTLLALGNINVDNTNELMFGQNSNFSTGNYQDCWCWRNSDRWYQQSYTIGSHLLGAGASEFLHREKQTNHLDTD